MQFSDVIFLMNNLNINNVILHLIIIIIDLAISWSARVAKS